MHHSLFIIILATAVGISTGSPIEVSTPEKPISKRSWFYSSMTEGFNPENHPLGQQYVIADYPNWEITLDGGHICSSMVVPYLPDNQSGTQSVVGPLYAMEEMLTDVDGARRNDIVLATWSAQQGLFDGLTEACGLGTYETGRHPLQPQRVLLGQIDLRLAFLGASIFTAYTASMMVSAFQPDRTAEQAEGIALTTAMAVGLAYIFLDVAAWIDGQEQIEVPHAVALIVTAGLMQGVGAATAKDLEEKLKLPPANTCPSESNVDAALRQLSQSVYEPLHLVKDDDVRETISKPGLICPNPVIA